MEDLVYMLGGLDPDGTATAIQTDKHGHVITADQWKTILLLEDRIRDLEIDVVAKADRIRRLEDAITRVGYWYDVGGWEVSETDLRDCLHEALKDMFADANNVVPEDNQSADKGE